MISCAAAAQWTVEVLHPTGKSESQVYTCAGPNQTGYAIVGGVFHASGWSGTMGSWVDLHPVGAELSVATGRSGASQYGYALIADAYQASGWMNLAQSWFSLNPAGATASTIHGTSATRQVGYAVVDGKTKASLWMGSAGSWTSLDPASATSSVAMASFEDSLSNWQAGIATVGGNDHASLWSGTPGSWVDLHPEDAIASMAYGVYGGLQVGATILVDFENASLWGGTAGSWINLNPAGSTSSVAFGILGTTQVGFATFSGKKHAGYWTGSAASWTDLHSFLPAEYDTSVARSITTDGTYDYVGGHGYNTATLHTEALLWKRPTELNDSFAFTLNKAIVAGQNSVQGTISATITSSSPRVYTTYDDSSLVTTPATVTLAANTFVRNFQITVMAVNSAINTTIYAKRGATVHSQPLTLTPLVPTALSFTPNPVTGGQSTLGRVVINGVAGPSGRTIALFDNSAFSTTPSNVVVPSGASSANFTITTLPVTAMKTVTVTARVSAGEKTATFRINP